MSVNLGNASPPGGVNFGPMSGRSSQTRMSARGARDLTNKKSCYILAGAAALSFVVVSATLMYSKILAIALTALSIVSVFFTVVAYAAYKSESADRVQYLGDLQHATQGSFEFLQEHANQVIRFVVDKVYPNPLAN